MNIIKILRKLKGIKQAELRDYLGVSQYDIIMIEKGCKIPDEKTYIKLAEFFNVTMDSLKQKSLSDRESIFALILGETIKDLRLQFGFTQVELAKQVGVSKSTISDWEKGNKEPKASAIYQLSKVFNITTDYLLGLNSFIDEYLAPPVICDDFSNDEQVLISDYRNLNNSGKTLIKCTIKTLLTTSSENKHKKYKIS